MHDRAILNEESRHDRCSGGPSTPADPAVAGGRQPQGGARRAPPWDFQRKKGERTEGAPEGRPFKGASANSGGARRASPEGR